MGDEVEPVKLTSPVRAVLTTLVARRGVKLPVADIAVTSRLSASAVRRVLDQLGKAGLVQHCLMPSRENRPPRLGFWLTPAGYATGRGLEPGA